MKKLILLAGVISLMACKKESKEDLLPTPPQVVVVDKIVNDWKVVSIVKNQVNLNHDSSSYSFYQDGNGVKDGVSFDYVKSESNLTLTFENTGSSETLDDLIKNYTIVELNDSIMQLDNKDGLKTLEVVD